MKGYNRSKIFLTLNIKNIQQNSQNNTFACNKFNIYNINNYELF